MRVNTEKMMKVNHNGKEIAFGKTRKNEFGEWVIKIYENGVFSEDMTIYELTKEDAEASRDAVIEMWSKAEQKANEKVKESETKEETVEETITLTEKERTVLDEIIKESDFNFDSLDINKSWNEQELEDDECFWSFPNVKKYGCGMDKQAVRGIFGSLVKKGLIFIDDEDCGGWLYIREEQFNRIRRAYGKVGR